MTLDTTQQRASIFHGYGATPADHWFESLAEQLEADGIPTVIPALPRPLEPISDQWDQVVRTALDTIDEHSIIVAHSLGCLTVLRYLRSLTGPWRLGTLVLVSGFVELLPALPDLDDFIAEGCDVIGLSEHVDRIAILRSDEDPFVPTGHTDHLADLLGVAVQVVPGAGHFLATDGVTSLREAREAISL